MNANDFTVLRIKLEHALQKLGYIKEALMNLCLWQKDSKAGFEILLPISLNALSLNVC